MDLTLFIIMIIFSFMMYYLIESITSLLKEIREIKNKCIATNNAKMEDFEVETPEPGKVIKKKMMQRMI